MDRKQDNYSLSTFKDLKMNMFSAVKGEIVNDDTLWIGVELEVEGRNRTFQRDFVSKEVKMFATVRGDGSLSTHGFEIVSVPGTLNFHRECWAPFLDNVKDKIRGWKGYNCGMHVHLSRSAIKDETFGKMLVFIHHSMNQSFVTNVGGRESNTYNERYPKTLEDAKYILRSGSSSHFDAFSLSGHTGKTAEMRIFRSNVSSNGFLKNLDFAHALKYFCDSHTAQQLSEKDFVFWMKDPENQEQYPYLTKWMKREGYFKKNYNTGGSVKKKAA